MLKKYKIINIINLKRETQLNVLKVRNELLVRKWMYTENEIKEDEHFSWIESLKNNKKKICLIILTNDLQPVGAMNLNFDKLNNIVEYGCYKSSLHNEKGLINKCLYNVIEYLFNNLGYDKIFSEVIEGNEKSLIMLKRVLFQEEGFLHSHIIKESKRLGIYIYSLLKNEWNNKKENCNFINDLEIEIVNF